MDNSLKEELNNGKDDVQDYLNARLDLLRLNMAENFSKVLSGFIIKSVILFVLFFALLFISLAVANWLNATYDYPGIGFIFVAGFYLLFIIVFWMLRRVLIEKPIIQSMIEIFFPPEHNYYNKGDE
jgi:uncharacterized membrane protein YqjE